MGEFKALIWMNWFDDDEERERERGEIFAQIIFNNLVVQGRGENMMLKMRFINIAGIRIYFFIIPVFSSFPSIFPISFF